MDEEIKNILTQLQKYLEKINLQNDGKLIELDDKVRLDELIKEIKKNHIDLSNEIRKFDSINSYQKLDYDYAFSLRNKVLVLQNNYVELFYISERITMRTKFLDIK